MESREGFCLERKGKVIEGLDETKSLTGFVTPSLSLLVPLISVLLNSSAILK